MPYAHFTRQERVTLACLLKHENSVRNISRMLGKHRCTIYREIQRNSKPSRMTTVRVNKPRELFVDSRRYRGQSVVEDIRDKKRSYYERLQKFEASKPHYEATYAEENHRTRQLVAKDGRRKVHRPEYAESFALANALITKRTSPGQVSSRLRRLGMPYLSDNVLYAYIARDNQELIQHLRRRGKKPRLRPKTAYNQTNGRKPIHVRPDVVSALTRIGDLEGDTIVGSDKRDRILTHVDRKSGLASLGLVIGYDSDRIRRTTSIDINRVFGSAYTITYDNGSEFSAWSKTEQDTGTDVYFADTYHSCQRARNENLNGLVRDFIPKGTDFKKLRRRDILEIETILNTRPRIRLDGLTPIEAYGSEIGSGVSHL